MTIVTTIVGDDGNVKFRVFTHEVADVGLHRVISDELRARGLFQSIREDDINDAVHVLWNASTGMFTLPQSYQDSDLSNWNPNMDLLTAFTTEEARERVNQGPRDVVYVAPLPNGGVPDDGALTYSTVESLKDLFGDIKPGHCFLFSESPDSLAVLKVINDNPNIVPFSAVRLEGLISVEYSSSFMRDSWALHAEQYHSVLGAFAERVQADHAAKKEVAMTSTFHREKQARTRLSGNQRRHSAFDVVSPDASANDLDVGSTGD